MFIRWIAGPTTRRIGDVTVVAAERNPERHDALVYVTTGATTQTRAVVWDLSRVRRFGVSALGILLAAKALGTRKGIYIAAICPPTHRIALIVLCRIATVVDIYASEESAIAAVNVGHRPRATASRREVA